MRARVGGDWKEVTGGFVRVAGTWRRLNGIRAYVGGVWRDVASFVQPLTLSVTPNFTSAIIFGAGTAVSDVVTATPNGGLGPYTYAWTRTVGSGSIASPTSASTTFSQALSSGQEVNGTFQCVVTDALGNTASDSVEVNFLSADFS